MGKSIIAAARTAAQEMGKRKEFMIKKTYFSRIVCFTLACVCILGGCSGNGRKIQADSENSQGQAQTAIEDEESPTQAVLGNEEGQTQTAIEEEESLAQAVSEDGQSQEQSDSEDGQGALEDGHKKEQPSSEESRPEAQEILEEDWQEYFEGLNGAAVVYDVSEMRYTVFNTELARTRRSPCSTFKIISSLAALERGIIEPDDSVHTWSGEVFWNEDWNRDIGFQEAFKTSCVWYFREIIDEIGQEAMQEELDRLQYGNRDISDWEGRLNTNNNNRALTGFWIESSLMVSPKEQTEVMERIFGEDSVYSEKTLKQLKQVMLVPDSDYDGNTSDISIYGKTGMGKEKGIVVDAWFSGFAQHGDRNIYFCVYLGRTNDKNVSSAVAKDIAMRIMSDYCSPGEETL